MRSLYLILFTLSALMAQDAREPRPNAAERPEAAAEEPPELLTFRFRPRALHRFRTPLHHGGSVAVTSLGYGLGLDLAFDRDTQLGFSIDYGSHSYVFEGHRGFGGLDPWERIQTLSLGASFRTTLGRSFGVFISPSLRYAGEPRAHFGDSLSWGVIVGFSYGFGPDLQLGLGVSISESLDGHIRAFPLPWLRWRFAERFTLSTRLRTLSGGGLELAFAALEELELAVGFGFTSLEFRNNDETIGRDSYWPLVARVSWAVTPTFQLDLFGGAAFFGELELDTARGRSIDEGEYDAAGFVGLQLNIGF